MTIYSKWEMIESMEALRTALTAKGLISPEVTLSMSTSEWSPIRLEMHYKVRDDSTYTYQTFKAENAFEVDVVVEKATKFVADLKTREELEHEEFMAMLGRVMDRAKDMGLDSDFINPLTSMMKKLATNALEDKR